MRRDGGGKGCVSAGLGGSWRADRGVGLQLGITDSCSGSCGQGLFLMAVIYLQHSALCTSYLPTPLHVGTCTAPWTSPIGTHSAEGPPASPWSAWRMGGREGAKPCTHSKALQARQGRRGGILFLLVHLLCHAWVETPQKGAPDAAGHGDEDKGMLSCLRTMEQPWCPPAATGPLHPLQHQGSLQEHPHSAVGHTQSPPLGVTTVSVLIVESQNY